MSLPTNFFIGRGGGGPSYSGLTIVDLETNQSTTTYTGSSPLVGGAGLQYVNQHTGIADVPTSYVYSTLSDPSLVQQNNGHIQIDIANATSASFNLYGCRGGAFYGSGNGYGGAGNQINGDIDLAALNALGVTKLVVGLGYRGVDIFSNSGNAPSASGGGACVIGYIDTSNFVQPLVVAAGGGGGGSDYSGSLSYQDGSGAFLPSNNLMSTFSVLNSTYQDSGRMSHDGFNGNEESWVDDHPGSTGAGHGASWNYAALEYGSVGSYADSHPSLKSLLNSSISGPSTFSFNNATYNNNDTSGPVYMGGGIGAYGGGGGAGYFGGFHGQFPNTSGGYGGQSYVNLSYVSNHTWSNSNNDKGVVSMTII